MSETETVDVPRGCLPVLNLSFSDASLFKFHNTIAMFSTLTLLYINIAPLRNIQYYNVDVFWLDMTS